MVALVVSKTGFRGLEQGGSGRNQGIGDRRHFLCLLLLLLLLLKSLAKSLGIEDDRLAIVGTKDCRWHALDQLKMRRTMRTQFSISVRFSLVSFVIVITTISVASSVVSYFYNALQCQLSTQLWVCHDWLRGYKCRFQPTNQSIHSIIIQSINLLISKQII